MTRDFVSAALLLAIGALMVAAAVYLHLSADRPGTDRAECYAEARRLAETRADSAGVDLHLRRLCDERYPAE